MQITAATLAADKCATVDLTVLDKNRPPLPALEMIYYKSKIYHDVGWFIDICISDYFSYIKNIPLDQNLFSIF